MKKQKLLTMALATVMGLSVFTGCTSKNDNGAAKEDNNNVAAQEDLKADIVVIGAGGAGMSAAIEAMQNGAKNVVILEKMPQTGGNTIRTTGGMNAAATELQAKEGIEDSVELMVEDTMKGGKNLNDEKLVKVLAYHNCQ